MSGGWQGRPIGAIGFRIGEPQSNVQGSGNDVDLTVTPPGLGEWAHDVITGFAGTVTARCTYLTGVEQLQLTPKVSATGDRRTAEWFDAERVCLAADPTADPTIFGYGAQR